MMSSLRDVRYLSTTPDGGDRLVDRRAAIGIIPVFASELFIRADRVRHDSGTWERQAGRTQGSPSCRWRPFIRGRLLPERWSGVARHMAAPPTTSLRAGRDGEPVLQVHQWRNNVTAGAARPVAQPAWNDRQLDGWRFEDAYGHPRACSTIWSRPSRASTWWWYGLRLPLTPGASRPVGRRRWGEAGTMAAAVPPDADGVGHRPPRWPIRGVAAVRRRVDRLGPTSRGPATRGRPGELRSRICHRPARVRSGGSCDVRSERGAARQHGVGGDDALRTGGRRGASRYRGQADPDHRRSQQRQAGYRATE